MTLNQISITKLNSRHKHEQFSVLRAYAVLYFERLSLKHINYLKLHELK